MLHFIYLNFVLILLYTILFPISTKMLAENTMDVVELCNPVRTSVFRLIALLCRWNCRSGQLSPTAVFGIFYDEILYLP